MTQKTEAVVYKISVDCLSTVTWACLTTGKITLENVAFSQLTGGLSTREKCLLDSNLIVFTFDLNYGSAIKLYMTK